MADVTSVSSQIDTLVQQYKATLQGPVSRLQTQNDTLSTRLSDLTSLKSKLSTLSTTINNLALGGTDSPFLAYAVASSDKNVMTATASALATAGSHTLKVSQLASFDTLLSNSMVTSADSGMAAGQAYSFSLKIGSADAVPLSVQFSSTKNIDVLNAIARSVNSNATLSGTVTASVVNVDGTNSRLVLTSKTSGASNAISLAGGNFQSMLGFGVVDFSNRTASGSATAGFLKTGLASDVLNSRFTVDGISITRESNKVADVLPGVTFSLTAPQEDTDAPVTVDVSIDKDTVKKKIQEFVDNYNSVISFIRSKSLTDTTTKTRGSLADDASSRSLLSSLRQTVGGMIAGVSKGNPSLLTTIGLKIGADGTLSISDSTTLDSAITTDIKKVSDLFTNASGDGIATKLKAQLDKFVSVGGTIESTSSGLRTQVSHNTDRIKKLNAQIDVKGEAYRNAWAQIEVLISKANSQYNMVSSLLA